MKNRLIVIAVAIAAVVLLGLPFAMGELTETRVRAEVAAIDSNPLISAEITSYERSWFTSRARIELGISPEYFEQFPANGLSAQLMPAERLPVVVELRHGPVQLGRSFRFGMASVVAHPDPGSELVRALQTRFAMPYLFEFRGRSGFGGGLDFDADIPPIDYADDDGSLTFSGLLVDGSLAGRHVVSHARMDGLQYMHPLATTSVQGLSVDADYELAPQRVALGAATVEIERVSVTSSLMGPDPVFDARGLSLRNESRIDRGGDRLELAVVYAADSIAAGPTFALGDATLGVTVGNLDADAMHDYYEIVQRDLSGTPADPFAAIAELNSVAERILVAEPTLALGPFEFSMDGEPFSGTARVETDATALPANADFDLEDPTLWMALLSLDADATISKVLAQRFAAQVVKTQLAAAGDDLPPAQLDAIARAQAGLLLASLSGQGLLTDRGESYTTTLAYDGGALTVNGSTVPFALP